MFCPNCGQERTSPDTSFCSRCGFLLTGTSELILTGGASPQELVSASDTAAKARGRGVRQGMLIFLLALLLVPIMSFVSKALGLSPIVPVVTAMLAILLGVASLFRMGYALMIEGRETRRSTSTISDETRGDLAKSTTQRSLPGSQTVPVSDYGLPGTGMWRDTNDLQPASVTENTTKLLEKDE